MKTSIDYSEQTIHDVVSKLKFISKIKKSMKVDIHSLRMYEDTLFTNICRSFVRQASRHETIEFVRTIVNQGFDIGSHHLKKDQSKDQLCHQLGLMIIKEISEAKVGIKNLTETYHHDKMFVSRIETLLSTIDAKLEVFTRSYPELKEKQQNIFDSPLTEEKE